MIADEIRRLHELHQAGALTDAEFEQAKAKILSSANVNLHKATSSSGTAGGSFAAELNALRRSRSDRWISVVRGHGVPTVRTLRPVTGNTKERINEHRKTI